MQKITSRSNEKIKRAVRLGESTAFRKECSEFFLEGARLCRDAVRTGITVTEAYFTEQAFEKYPEYVSEIENAAEECFTVSSDAAKKLSGTDASQGVFCVCRIPDKTASGKNIDPNGRYIALENVQDPANLGAVCRTAEAIGISGIIVSGGCDIYNPKALRAAMGSSLRFNVMTCADLPALIRQANGAGMLTLASIPAKGADTLGSFALNGGIICAVGNEGNGLTEEVKNACSRLVTIPMAGRAESLNAAAAAAILIWEISGKDNAND